MSTRAPRTPASAAREVAALARRAGALDASSLPATTLRKARLCLLDALGNMVAAADLPEALSVARAEGPFPRGGGTIFGWADRTTTARAAFHNAVHLDLLEAQDGHRHAGLHPCEGTLPVGLAVGQNQKSELGELLAATVGGYEVMIRFGAALFPDQTQEGFYPDGTCGPLGGALTASRLLGSDPGTVLRALSAAAFAAPLSLVQTMRSTAKPLIAGMTAELGLRSAIWARGGLGGSLGSFEGPHGFLEQLSPRPRYDRLRAARASSWAIDEVYLKPYPGGRHAHSPVDAAREILGEDGIDPRSVRTVDVRTYRAALALTGSMPGSKSPLAELTQSTRYAIAAGIADGMLGPARFAPDRRHDPAVLALARRIRLVEDPRATRNYPRTTTAAVTLTFRDGRTARSVVRHRWGDPERPMSVEEVRAKFRRSLGGRSTADKAWETWWSASLSSPVDELIGRFSEQVGPPAR